MTTIIDLNTGQVLGVVDGRNQNFMGDREGLAVQAVPIDLVAFGRALRMRRSRS